MPTFKVDFEVYCASCGAGLCKQSYTNDLTVRVDPCQDCLDAAREDGRNDGYNDAIADNKEGDE